jgi:hypothetical protein
MLEIYTNAWSDLVGSKIALLHPAHFNFSYSCVSTCWNESSIIPIFGITDITTLMKLTPPIKQRIIDRPVHDDDKYQNFQDLDWRLDWSLP